ncbi:MAG TPA: hypothetical protein VGN14_16025 [Candidatus Elarobacter sp.]
MRAKVSQANGLDCCGHPRERHDDTGCTTWLPGTRHSAPGPCACKVPKPRMASPPAPWILPAPLIALDAQRGRPRRRR